jgi:hypothetical protein
MSRDYRYRQRAKPPEQRRPNRILLTLVLIVWVVLGALVVYQSFFRQQVSQQLGQQISDRLGGSAPISTPLPGQTAIPAAQQQVAGVLPTLVAALPVGEIHISEQEANQYILANQAQLDPIESATLRFVPGQIQADLVALGSSSTASTGVTTQNGQIIAINPQIEGPLSNLVDLSELIGPLLRRLNGELTSQGRRITAVQVEQGFLVINVEQ